MPTASAQHSAYNGDTSNIVVCVKLDAIIQMSSARYNLLDVVYSCGKHGQLKMVECSNVYTFIYHCKGSHRMIFIVSTLWCWAKVCLLCVRMCTIQYHPVQDN